MPGLQHLQREQPSYATPHLMPHALEQKGQGLGGVPVVLDHEGTRRAKTLTPFARLVVVPPTGSQTRSSSPISPASVTSSMPPPC